MWYEMLNGQSLLRVELWSRGSYVQYKIGEALHEIATDQSSFTRNTKAEKPESGVYECSSDNPETVQETMVTMMLNGLRYDGVETPTVIAYGTTREDAHAIAELIKKHNPNAKVIIEWGNASSEELQKMRVEKGADRVLVRRRNKAMAEAEPKKEKDLPRKDIKKKTDFYPFFPPPPGGGGGGSNGGGGRGGGDGPSISPHTPSNVGGVYLRGAGEAIKDLGPLIGVAIDESNAGWCSCRKKKAQSDSHHCVWMT
jgi:hypothetical protein